jgi:hypothetical protein
MTLAGQAELKEFYDDVCAQESLLRKGKIVGAGLCRRRRCLSENGQVAE